ncbi:MarR family winged helix-turn-helix transcriptional regulator [Amycolatopsis orientalis]|uniref:MarR family winged helix-turn-helix transcriptional regulator n=1 Tax=Amycolatopsis orientalis TaxID=31958 RepID=UPI00039EBE35|nr:MarR family transcriptional regulator [Amycolatopsis orientalis]
MEPTLGYLVWRLSMKWRSSVDRALAPLGLTHAQYAVLASLSGLSARGPEPSQRQLADHAGLEPIYVSKLARALENARLIERPVHPDDPRAVRLVLTDRGRKTVAEAIAIVRSLMTEQTAAIGGPNGKQAKEFRENLLALLGENPSP